VPGALRQLNQGFLKKQEAVYLGGLGWTPETAQSRIVGINLMRISSWARTTTPQAKPVCGVFGSSLSKSIYQAANRRNRFICSVRLGFHSVRDFCWWLHGHSSFRTFKLTPVCMMIRSYGQSESCQRRIVNVSVTTATITSTSERKLSVPAARLPVLFIIIMYDVMHLIIVAMPCM